MPDLAQLLGQVHWEYVVLASIFVILLQFIAAVIHPVVFYLTTLVLIGGLFAIGISDGTAHKDVAKFHGQLFEMILVGVVVIVSHAIIRTGFTAMARSTREA